MSTSARRATSLNSSLSDTDLPLSSSPASPIQRSNTLPEPLYANRRASLDRLNGRTRSKSPKARPSSADHSGLKEVHRNITLLDTRRRGFSPSPNSSPLLAPVAISQTESIRPALSRHRHTTSASSSMETSMESPFVGHAGHVLSHDVRLSRATAGPKARVDSMPSSSCGTTSHPMGLSSSASEDDSEQVRDGAEKNRLRRNMRRKADSDSELMKSTTSNSSADTSDRWHDVHDLPPNPKLWLPSHLAIYLSAYLSLHPRLAADITHFIKTSRLSGRTFLRLRNKDLEDMGINLRWRTALQEARETLRKEALGGRIFWGFEGGSAPEDGDGNDKDEDHARLLLSFSSGLSASPASSAQTHRAAGSSDGHASGSSDSGSRPPSVGSGMPYRHQRASYQHAHHSRHASVEVEGRDDDDEIIKEEWKQSWKRLVHLGGRGKVRGMASAFEKVDETSRENSPVKSRNSLLVENDSSPMKQEDERRLSRIWVRGVHERHDSTESNMSDASIDSGSGRNALSSATVGDSGDDPTTRPRNSSQRQPSVRSAVDVFRSDDLPIASTSYQSHIISQPRPYELVRRVSQNNKRTSSKSALMQPPIAETSTIRGPSSSSRRCSAARNTMSREDKRKSLADLFDLDIPRVSTLRNAELAVAEPNPDELVEWEVGATNGKRGSMVLVKRSQLEALSRRMDEVEEALAASLHGGSEAPASGTEGSSRDGSSPIGSVRSGASAVTNKGSAESTAALELLNQRLENIENRLPTNPASPRSARLANFSTPPATLVDSAMSSWVAHQLTLSEIESSRLARRREFEDQQRADLERSQAHRNEMAAREAQNVAENGPLSWSALGGYVVAASIGIGIVAGEVVAARLFNVRAGRH